MNREKILLKYSFDSYPRDLFLALTQTTFLQNWIAEKVDFDKEAKIYTFHWSDFSESAKIVEEVQDKYIKWEWMGGDHEEGEFVSFRIVEIMGDDMIDLYVEDFCDSSDKEQLTEAWEKQISRLELVLK